ncbi:MAG TPA: PEP-CTERM sorting domain-containing protein, partial [Cyanothece sp. UBA12306]|nr:PEP-CTERM sorting domain-containing protein [Cyanothece sp. UBA12306]
MTYSLRKITLATSAIALTLSLVPTTSVQAAMITYSFSGTTDSGSLNNESYSGTFSFDDSDLTGSFLEFLPILDVTFKFLGTTFDQSDAVATPTANFSFGQFLGLSYSVDNFEPTFSIIAGFPSINDAYFAYDTNTGNAGTGNISYSTVNSVPEPLTILG